MQQAPNDESSWLWRMAQAMFNGAAEGILLVSVETRQALAFNRAAARLLGMDWQPDTPQGRLPTDWRQAAPAALPEALAALLASPEVQAQTPLELELPSPRPGAPDLRVTLYPLEQGTHVVYLRPEVSSTALRAELDEALAALREAQDAVNTAASAGGSISLAEWEARLAKVRHDLRNYINVMAGYAEVMLARLRDRRQIENAQMIYDAAQEANRLITAQLRLPDETPTGLPAEPEIGGLAQRLQAIIARLEALRQSMSG